jgi:hypothetical protein
MARARKIINYWCLRRLNVKLVRSFNLDYVISREIYLFIFYYIANVSHLDSNESSIVLFLFTHCYIYQQNN